LHGDPNLRPIYGEMFRVWDGDHIFQVWFPYIEKVHAFYVDWHICVDNFVLHTKSGLIELLTTMIELNK
jgi:hypothetical protein